jgi:hypothetical protein
VPVSVPGPSSPHVVDWNYDGKPDLVLGDGNGLIWRFNNTGNGLFDDGYTLRLIGRSNLTISGEASPAIIDWNQDSYLDVVAAGDGFISYFQNVGNDTFRTEVRLTADGSNISHGSWSSLWTSDFDMDGLTDFQVGTLEGKVALYLNDGNNHTKFGGYLRTNNSILHDIDVGSRSKATTMDMDGDSYQEVLVGNSVGQILFFESNGAKASETSYTDLEGYSREIPVLEYQQKDSNGDGDGEDEGERTYLSPSVVQARRCNHTQSASPLPHLDEGLSLTIEMGFDLTLCPPVVHSTYPYHDQQDVRVSADLTFLFDKDMNKMSVQNALNISPPLSISQATWPSDNVITLDVELMDFDTVYTLIIDGGIAEDLSGMKLDGNMNGTSEGGPSDNFTLRFTTEEIPIIISNDPQGLGQSPDTTISACFNKPMFKSSVEQSLSISPTVKWSIWWGQNDGCIYVNTDLRLQTSYTISIPGDSTDLNGNTLDGNLNGQSEGHPIDAFEWQFSTISDSIPPRVLSTTPVSGELVVDLTTDITIELSESIDSRSLETGLAARNDTSFWDEGLEPGHSSIEDFGLLSFGESNFTISNAALQYDAYYEVTISGNMTTGATDLAGNPLDGDGDGSSEGSPIDDFVLAFSTLDPVPPSVVFTYPSQGEKDIDLAPTLRATFDDDMEPQTLNDSTVLLIDGLEAALNINISYYQDNNTLLLYPNELLSFRMTYTVVISAEVEDTSQNSLDGNGDGVGSGRSYDNFSWNFTTIPDTTSPILQILTPEQNASFTIGDIVNVTGIALDDDKINGLEFSINFEGWINITDSLNESDGSWSHELDTAAYEEGELRIRVRAIDPSENELTQVMFIRLHEEVTPFPIWIAVLVTIIILVSATFGYRYLRSTYVERTRVTDQQRTEIEEMLRKLEEEHESLAERAEAIEAKESDLETKESYLRDLDAHYESLAASLFEKERIDLEVGERIVAQNMGEDLSEVQRYEKAYILLSEAEASEAGEMTKKLPESGKKALLLVYFNALEAFLRDKLKGTIPSGATILLGEKGHINTRSKSWEEKWSTLSLGILSHAIDHNKHFFVEDEEQWEETKTLMRELVDIRNLTAHPSEANPDVDDVREGVYTAIKSLLEVLKKPRALKK